jgi:hypothetical protein
MKVLSVLPFNRIRARNARGRGKGKKKGEMLLIREGFKGWGREVSSSIECFLAIQTCSCI